MIIDVDFMFQIIKRSGEHLLMVVNDLLDYAKIENGKFELEKEPFDLVRLISSPYHYLFCLGRVSDVVYVADVSYIECVGGGSRPRETDGAVP